MFLSLPLFLPFLVLALFRSIFDHVTLAGWMRESGGGMQLRAGAARHLKVVLWVESGPMG